MKDIAYMGKLEEYDSIAIKGNVFIASMDDNTIETVEQFDKLHNELFAKMKAAPTQLFFRGVTEAKFKLYTSAQRHWIENDVEQWSDGDYFNYITSLIENAKNNPTLKQVFEKFNYQEEQKDYSILSLLQHYGCPSPLMDWTYNINVALFFAVDNINNASTNKSSDIDKYFSLYVIDKLEQSLFNEYNNITAPTEFDGKLEPLECFFQIPENYNAIAYISDFEKILNNNPQSALTIKSKLPLTTVFNQNIIPQEGLFILNPSGQKSLEEIWTVPETNDSSQISHSPFDCYNINKDLSEYIARKINTYNVNKDTIYPNMYKQVAKIKNDTLNGFAKATPADE